MAVLGTLILNALNSSELPDVWFWFDINFKVLESAKEIVKPCSDCSVDGSQVKPVGSRIRNESLGANRSRVLSLIRLNFKNRLTESDSI